MAATIFCLCLLVLVSIFVSCQAQRIRSGENAMNCSVMVRSCQNQCVEFPQQYVRWFVNTHQQSTQCRLFEQNQMRAERHSEETTIVYDVQCCSGNRNNIVIPPAHFSDDGKVNTLIVLGVGTLLSILLMCGFVFVGLIMIHRRKRKRRSKDKSSDSAKHSPAKEPRKSANSVISVAGTEFNPGQKENCTITSTCENRESENYCALACGDSSAPSPITNSNEVTDDVMLQRKSQEVYVNHASLALHAQNQVQTRCSVDDVYSPVTTKQNSCSAEAVENSDTHGRLVMPKSMLYQEESNYLRYSDLPKQVTLNALSTQTTNQMPSVKSKSNSVVEDPYVQVPPIKSHRCQPKSEKPHAYQTLVPNGCGVNGCELKEEGDEYNMLLHNSTVLSQDAKAFVLLNNNLKSSNCVSLENKNKTCVILKDQHPRGTASSKNRVKANR